MRVYTVIYQLPDSYIEADCEDDLNSLKNGKLTTEDLQEMAENDADIKITYVVHDNKEVVGD